MAALKFHIRPNPARGAKVIEHLASAEKTPKRRSIPERAAHDDFELWFRRQSEGDQKRLEARAIDLLSEKEKAEIADGKPTFTTQYQVEVNMRLLSQKQRATAAS